MIQSLPVLGAFVLGVTLIAWSGLWRLYRWLFRTGEVEEGERPVLERQIVAMAVYFPIHLGAILLPLQSDLRGAGSLVAAVFLAYIGASAISNRLFVAFNRQSQDDAAAVRERLAVYGGVVMLVLALIVSALGVHLLRQD